MTPPLNCEEIHVYLIRNFMVEGIARWINSFLGPAKLTAVFEYSDYDDSLMARVPTGTDLVIVMLDFRRFGELNTKLLAWIEERLIGIRSMTESPILMLGSDDEARSREGWNLGLESRLGSIPGLIVVDPGPSSDWDPEVSRTAQSPFSGRRSLDIARELGLRWIPASLGRHVRLLVIDLDNTLYSGTLGEDGVDGITFSANHRAILQRLAELHEGGLLLAISSRNQAEDVDALLAGGHLGELSRDHFLSIEADWGSKSDHLTRILNAARFSEEHVVFIDDNPGELLQVSGSFPDIGIIFAKDPGMTRLALEWFPGLWRPARSSEDLLRAKDLVANKLREQLSDVHSSSALSQLQITVRVNEQPVDSVRRLSELSSKTNQFNTNLARLPEPVLAARCKDSKSVLVAISLEDRFADSGIVGYISGQVNGDCLVLDDIAISCRALGRGIEDPVLDAVFTRLADRLGLSAIEILSVEGPRNGPALAWLSRAAQVVQSGRWSWIPRMEMKELVSQVNLIWNQPDGSCIPDVGVTRV